GEFEGVTVAVQEEPRGTGDAVAAAQEPLQGFDGDVLVLSGDAPVLADEVVVALLDEHRRARADATILSVEPADTSGYGRVLRDRVNRAHMLAGVTIVDPSSTWIGPDVELEADSTIHPFTVLRGRSRVAAGAEVGPHAVVADAVVGPNALVGPFCYLRPGTVLEADTKAGAFVEIKNSRLRRGAKVPHTAYVGDADVGEDANVAAGNITANFSHYPGREKGRTVIGRNVRTGVDNAFVAPVEVGDDAWVAPGSVITEDVPPGSLAGFPPRQVTKEGWVYDKRPDDDD